MWFSKLRPQICSQRINTGLPFISRTAQNESSCLLMSASMRLGWISNQISKLVKLNKVQLESHPLTWNPKMTLFLPNIKKKTEVCSTCIMFCQADKKKKICKLYFASDFCFLTTAALRVQRVANTLSEQMCSHFWMPFTKVSSQYKAMHLESRDAFGNWKKVLEKTLTL